MMLIYLRLVINLLRGSIIIIRFLLFIYFFSLYFNATTTNISVLIQAKQSIKINKSTFQIDSFIDYDLAYLTVHRQIHLLNIRKRISR